jgi:Gpi18-like mannosyltransferase
VVVLGCLFAAREWPCPVHGHNLERMYDRHFARLQAGPGRLIEPWYHWDAVWYAEISCEGYSYTPGRMSSVAFLPLLPLLMAGAGTLGLDRYWVGLIVPNVAFACGLACFARVAATVTGDRATAVRACVLLAAYPWSFFDSAPYEDSFGFALSAAALWA